MSTDEDWLAASAWAGLWPEGVDRLILDETDSTMAEAARRAPPGRPLWIMARRQTAGRGRRGRAWAHPDGNFAATLIFRPDRPAREAALTSFVAALALHDTLAAWVEPAHLSLKWPNDVLLQDRKVAGILLEASGRGEALDWLAVGIGINLVARPPMEALEPEAVAPVALADVAQYPRFEAACHEAEVVLAHLARSFHTQLAIWQDNDFSTVRSSWLEKAARRGEPVRARTGATETTGIFETVDEDGNLVLRTPEGPRRIAAADVYFD